MTLRGLLEIVAFVRGLRDSIGGATKSSAEPVLHEANTHTDFDA